MKLATPFDELPDRFEKGLVGGAGSGQLLSVARRAGQMGQALLLRAGRVCRVTDADLVAQEDGTAPQAGADAAAEDLTVTRLLHGFPASVTTSGGVTIQDDAIDTVNQVFLQMVHRVAMSLDGHRSLAQRAAAGGRHRNPPIVGRRRRPEPARMAHGSATFLAAGGNRRPGGRFGRVGRVGRLLLRSRELGLPLQLQFQFDLLQFEIVGKTVPQPCGLRNRRVTVENVIEGDLCHNGCD